MYQYPYGGYTTAPCYVYTGAIPETRDQFIRRYVMELGAHNEFATVHELLATARLVWDESIKTGEVSK